MSSPLLSPGQQNPQNHDVDWARLIPGALPPFRNPGKKPVPSVRGPVGNEISRITSTTPLTRTEENGLALLIPHPLQTRMAQAWLRSVAADFVMVGLNWLLLGALLVLDAMGAGLCVLTSDVPENREVVDGAEFTFQPAATPI